MKLLKILVWLIVYSLILWGALALHFLVPPRLAMGVPIAFAAFCGLLLPTYHPRRLAFLVFFCLLGAIIWRFLSLQPLQDRDWRREASVLPRADVIGDRVTVRNIRDFKYRSEDDVDVQYYDKTYDLTQMEGVDLFISFWGPKLIAHTMLSFAFRDGSHLAVSVETRKEQGEHYSSLAGFFRQYELMYVAADERDLIGVRANIRNEDIYLYRLGELKGPENEAKGRTVFLEYMKRLNHLAKQPQFYNALMDNCTTNVFMAFKAAPPYPELSLGVLLPGLLDRQIYQYFQKRRGLTLPFEEFRSRSRITPAARSAGQAPDFSQRIRADLP